MRHLPDPQDPQAVTRFLRGLRGYSEDEISRELTTGGDLEAIPPGTLMLDRDGLPFVKSAEGWFYFWDERLGRYVEVGLDEIMGLEDPDGESRFFPIRVIA